MSHRIRIIGVVTTLLAITIGITPTSFAASTSQHTHDPQIIVDVNNPPSAGLEGFEDFEEDMFVEVKAGQLNQGGIIDYKLIARIDAEDPDQTEGLSDISTGQMQQVNGIINYAKVYLSRFIKRCQPRDADFQEFRKVAGFSPETDITSITYGLTGDCTTRGSDIYVDFRGPFNRSEIEARLAKDERFAISQVDGLVTYTMTNAYKFAFLNDRTLLLASTPATNVSDPNASSSSSFDSLLAAGDKGRMYIALMVPENVKEQFRKRTVSEPLSYAQAVSLSLAFTTDSLKLTLIILADTPAHVATIAEKLQGLARSDDERTRDDRVLANILGNLNIRNSDIRLYDALNGFLRMGQVILDGKWLQLSKVEDGADIATGGSDAGWCRLVYVPVSGVKLSDLFERLTGVSIGLQEQ